MLWWACGGVCGIVDAHITCFLHIIISFVIAHIMLYITLHITMQVCRGGRGEQGALQLWCTQLPWVFELAYTYSDLHNVLCVVTYTMCCGSTRCKIRASSSFFLLLLHQLVPMHIKHDQHGLAFPFMHLRPPPLLFLPARCFPRSNSPFLFLPSSVLSLDKTSHILI